MTKINLNAMNSFLGTETAKSIIFSVNRMKLEAFLFFTGKYPKKELALKADLVSQLLFASLQKYVGVMLDGQICTFRALKISITDSSELLLQREKISSSRDTMRPMNSMIARIIEMRSRKICKLQIV